MNKRLGIKEFVLLAFCTAVTGAIVTSSTIGAIPPRGCGPRYCLDVWNPVTCSNGVTYSNLCYAQRACATGCVPGYPTE